MIESYLVPQSTAGFWHFEEGENQIAFESVDAIDNDGIRYKGDLIVTRYKLVFRQYDNYDSPDNPFTETIQNSELSLSSSMLLPHNSYADMPVHKARFFTVPVHLLYSVEIGINKKNVAETHIIWYTKDHRDFRFVLFNHDKWKNLYTNIRKVAFPNVLSKDVFALKYKFEPSSNENEEVKLTYEIAHGNATISPFSNLTKNGWDVYDFKKEYDRQGIQEIISKVRIQHWWYTDKSNSVCETYPEQVYVPAKMTNAALIKWAKYRAKHRFPALSYYYSKKGSSIWRSSQNSPGITSSRSAEDELMLKLIGAANSFTSSVSIYDARSKIKAFSNRAKGGGYENTDHYTKCEIFFWSIDNIHGVTHAYKKMFEGNHSFYLSFSFLLLRFSKYNLINECL